MASFNNPDSAGPSSEPAFDRSALKRHKGHAKQTSSKENQQHAEVAAGSPSFTKVITGKTTHHSAYCCRLCLPRKFCEEHSIPDHVTMTDATGTRVWKMRFQVRRAAPSYTISNGWREFSYDHSLKLGDELLFTLVSPSHFRVAFAAANGKRQRPMHPTRRECNGYPWKQNYSRIACLSAIRLPKQLQSEDIVTASPTEQEETAEPQNLDVTASPTEQEGTAEPQNLDRDVAVQVNAADMKGQSSNDLVEEKHFNPPKERFCQCKNFVVATQRSTTHLERTNPDGSTYLQIVDSDSEIDRSS